MSLLSRLKARAGTPVAGAAPLRPKGLPAAVQRAEEEEDALQTLRRQEEEEEAAQPLRRAETDKAQDTDPMAMLYRSEEEEEAQPLRREEEEEAAQPLRREEEEEAAQPLRRMEEEEEAQTLRREEEEEAAQPLRRIEEEEEAQTLRREEEEEAAQPLRRAEEENDAVQPLRRLEEEEEAAQPLRAMVWRQEEEEEDALQALRRMTPPEAEGLDAETAVPPDDLGGEPDRVSARPLRREAAPQAPSFDMAHGPEAAGPFLDQTTFADGPEPMAAGEPAAPPPAPAKVVIDQVDVVIHEPGAPASPGHGTAQDFARFARSRYLGGL